jgi:hypothetical protein
MAVENPYLNSMLGVPSGHEAALGGQMKAAGAAMMGKSAGAQMSIASILPMIIGMILEGQVKDIGGRLRRGREIKHIGEMTDELSPDTAYYESMMPELERENRLVQSLLLQQLGKSYPALAGGEMIIGGRRG